MGIRNYYSSAGQVPKIIFAALLLAWLGGMGVGILFLPDVAEAQGSPMGILHRHDPRVQEAIEVQERHTNWLMGNADVLGTGVGMGVDGQPVIKVFTAKHGVRGIPEWLEFVPVQVEATGMVMAFGTCPQGRCSRPVPVGVSTGHPLITAGTIGARITDGTKVYALSNNHVYANSNNANLGDSILQPGPYDGGTVSNDAIGTLSEFQPIDFSSSGVNYIDAAIALSTPDFLGHSTFGVADGGYGTPSSATKSASIGLGVQKYGRTTFKTSGQVSAINVTVQVCYEQTWIFCTKSAYFYDQIQISPAGFSAGGDSGSLIVTNDGLNNPVGLLFAGSDTTTFANRIDRVLCRFSKRVDDGESGNMPPTADFSYTTSGLTATFTDKSTDPDVCVKTWNWNFGDGTTSTIQNPTHTYANQGTYTVTLTVADTDSAPSINTASYPVAVTAPPQTPAAPTKLTASAVSRSQINLSWTDNAGNETGFKIERCLGSNCTNFAQIAIVGANVTTYSNTGLNRNTTYRYRVRAYNAGGDSPYSNIVSAKTLR